MGIDQPLSSYVSLIAVEHVVLDAQPDHGQPTDSRLMESR